MNSTTDKPKRSAKTTAVRKVLPYLAAIGSLLALWQVSSWILNKPFLLPGVPEVFGRLLRSFSNTDFMSGVADSMIRLGVAFPTACLLGAVLGLLAGVSHSFAVYLRGIISILQAIPPITWVPFFAILLGYGNATIITVIIIASFFPMALSMLNATEGINKTHLELARVLGASRGQLITKVFTPESFPAFITGAQVAFGNAWRSLIAAEMVGGAMSGLGYYSRWRGEVADMSGVLMSIVAIGTIAAVLDHLVLEKLKRRLLRYRYMTGGDN
ncbi:MULTISPECIES: ABC transporter permease [Paenibacillus]|uniref:ABC transporter permease subunit n=1 Tax=Paenibacillus oceani TaxID=2772510 RepID=A0A927CBC4_9BACL|nr:ABC transporter permease subunit [Paenibacillus oceani]MBD2864525.1 ABC transporter permease subunit [Paenibacillus oceani]